MLMSDSEVELVERAKRDGEAFGLLYEKYVDRIYAYIFYRTGDHHEAEDLTARVFYRALARIADFDQRGAPFVAWLYRIAHNLVANWHRDRARRGQVSLEGLVLLPSSEEPPPQTALRNEEEAELLSGIRRLPSDRQQVLILKFVEGLTNKQIGGILERSEGAIKSLYHRTLIELRQEIDKKHEATRARD